MQGPALLPKALAYCESFATEEELFQALVKKPSDLIDFFEVACADETWAGRHLPLICSLMRWGAKRYYLSQFPLYYAERMARAIQEHYSLLESLLYFRPSLFYTIGLEVEGQKVFANTLLYGTASSFFFNLFKVNCFDRMSDQWALSDVPLQLFRLAEEFINKGEVTELWRSQQPEVYALMRLAKSWGLSKLVKECADVLRRYINKDNVIETLLKAHREFFLEWKQDCIDFFNQQGWGLRLLPGREADLKVELLNDKEDTMELLNKLAPWLTHLAFRGRLSEEPLYREWIYRCPRLIGIDLSGSTSYTNQFDDIPTSISELDLSACAWLGATHLQKAAAKFPFLRELNLSSNTHLNYLVWGELPRFRQLMTLHLARCHQINDEDLKLISQSSSGLSELDLEECRGFTDRGILEVVQYCPRLSILNLSRCYTITDKALMEIGARASHLTRLYLVRCTTLTDKGLLQFIRLHPTLHVLDVRHCEFSFQAINEIKRQYPLIKILD